jgi:hypothetical protein
MRVGREDRVEIFLDRKIIDGGEGYVPVFVVFEKFGESVEWTGTGTGTMGGRDSERNFVVV